MFVERKDGAFALRRGFALEAGEPVVVVEDVFTTGKSTREAAAAVEAAGGRVVAVGSIVDRGLPAGRLRVPSRSLLVALGAVLAEAECPLCEKGVPIDSPGSRFSVAREAPPARPRERPRAPGSASSPSPRQALPCMQASVVGSRRPRGVPRIGPAFFECE